MKITKNAIHGVRLAMIGLVTGLSAAPAMAADTPNGIDRTLYFDADIRDAEFCELSIDSTGKVDFGKEVTNPSMTCPDAFSWYLFTKVVKDEFWIRWADELQNWPAEPWPLCTSDGGNCCDPTSTSNDPDHCPSFPATGMADALKSAAPLLDSDGNEKSARNQRKMVSQFFEENAMLVRAGAPRGKGVAPAVVKSSVDALPECSSSQIKSILPDDPQSIGRVLRQTNSEITIRNAPFHDYLFENDLYNTEGLKNTYNNNAGNQRANAPFHQGNQSASQGSSGSLYRVDLPPDAIMIKSNWVSATLVDAIQRRYPKETVQFGAPDDYIRHPFMTQITTANGDKCKLQDSHYLMSFHVSSKDIPQWVWATFEHKNNPGRCDYTGCNDSFGFLAQQPDGTASNFIAPNQRSDQLAQSSTVLENDMQYAAGSVSAGLKALLRAQGVATGQQSGVFANPTDVAWANYRLKGSQVDFTDHQGRPTHLGNSITEAGFMTRSSCVGCHARAGAAVMGEGDAATVNTIPLGVFEAELSEFGYQQSHHGGPVHAWYYKDNPSFDLQVLQTDFIWGFLNAQPLVK